MTDGTDEANTPLSADAFDGLIPSWVATQSDLNSAEAENVAAGYVWLRHNQPTVQDQLTTAFVRRLHQALFGDVWKWAGTFRTVHVTIGVDWPLITGNVKQLTDDFAYRMADVRRPATTDELDLACVGYHHRMVQIHPFLNGNGRHARASADALAAAVGRPPFSWGGASIGPPSATRHTYIEALRKADQGDLGPLLSFARS